MDSKLFQKAKDNRYALDVVIKAKADILEKVKFIKGNHSLNANIHPRKYLEAFIQLEEEVYTICNKKLSELMKTIEEDFKEI